jgi:hypothetical protein
VSFLMRRAAMGGFLKGPGASISAFDNPLAALPPLARMRAAIALLPEAFGKLVWPRTLVGDYGSHAIPPAEMESGAAFAAGLFLLAALAAAVVLLARRKETARTAAFGLFWAAVSYVPFANVAFLTGTAFAERLLYAPAAGAALAAAALLRAPSSRPARAACAAAGFLLCLLGAVRIESRIPEWRDDETLFRSVVRDRPGNGRAWFDLTLVDLSRRDGPAARRDLENALRADPSLARDAKELLEHARRIGRPVEEEAIRGALEAARQRP